MSREPQTKAAGHRIPIRMISRFVMALAALAWLLANAQTSAWASATHAVVFFPEGNEEALFSNVPKHIISDLAQVPFVFDVRNTETSESAVLVAYFDALAGQFTSRITAPLSDGATGSTGGAVAQTETETSETATVIASNQVTAGMQHVSIASIINDHVDVVDIPDEVESSSAEAVGASGKVISVFDHDTADSRRVISSSVITPNPSGTAPSISDLVTVIDITGDGLSGIGLDARPNAANGSATARGATIVGTNELIRLNPFTLSGSTLTPDPPITVFDENAPGEDRRISSGVDVTAFAPNGQPESFVTHLTLDRSGERPNVYTSNAVPETTQVTEPRMVLPEAFSPDTASPLGGGAIAMIANGFQEGFLLRYLNRHGAAISPIIPLGPGVDGAVGMSEPGEDGKTTVVTGVMDFSTGSPQTTAKVFEIPNAVHDSNVVYFNPIVPEIEDFEFTADEPDQSADVVENPLGPGHVLELSTPSAGLADVVARTTFDVRTPLEAPEGEAFDLTIDLAFDLAFDAGFTDNDGNVSLDLSLGDQAGVDPRLEFAAKLTAANLLAVGASPLQLVKVTQTLTAENVGASHPELVDLLEEGGALLDLAIALNAGGDPTVWVNDLIVSMRFVEPPVPGDADGDGDVDAFDLGLWQTQFGMTGDDLSADFDMDGDVDAFDLGIWQINFGTGLDSTAAPRVPEPATVALLTLGLAVRPRRPIRTR